MIHWSYAADTNGVAGYEGSSSGAIVKVDAFPSPNAVNFFAFLQQYGCPNRSRRDERELGRHAVEILIFCDVLRSKKKCPAARDTQTSMLCGSKLKTEDWTMSEYLFIWIGAGQRNHVVRKHAADHAQSG